MFFYDVSKSHHMPRKDGDKSFKFHGWNTILHRNKFKKCDTNVFWWDVFHLRLSFKQFMLSFV